MCFRVMFLVMSVSAEVRPYARFIVTPRNLGCEMA